MRVKSEMFLLVILMENVVLTVMISKDTKLINAECQTYLGCGPCISHAGCVYCIDRDYTSHLRCGTRLVNSGYFGEYTK